MKNLRQTTDDAEDPLKKKFIKGAMKYSKIPKQEASELYDSMTLYLFNKGHGAGYGLISFYQMYLKKYFPLEFWCSTLKYEGDDSKVEIYKSCAVRDGCIIFLPHVNGKAQFRITKVSGDDVIQEGLSSIKNVGLKSAQVIEQLGPYKDENDFILRVPKRAVNARVMEALKNAGALEFNRNKFIKRVVAYNSTLYSKNLQVR
jgi:DNA polymerase-3 subunit alpha